METNIPLKGPDGKVCMGVVDYNRLLKLHEDILKLVSDSDATMYEALGILAAVKDEILNDMYEQE